MMEFEQIKNILKQEPKLIKLPAQGKAVFVGDTHGDLEATELILEKYFKAGYFLVFLGDYVDRGNYSRENIELLLQKKLETPERIFLLMGNHEGHPIFPFYPADFWDTLSFPEREEFKEIFQLLPLVAITENGLIGVHGVPPDVACLEDINHIQPGDKLWQQITWGDLAEAPGDFLGDFWGRPVYGQTYFERVMARLNRTVLIRAHQLHIDPIVFSRRCLTIITSHAYSHIRHIAIADLAKPVIKTVSDLEILEI